jgi:hypothetical protein
MPGGGGLLSWSGVADRIDGELMDAVEGLRLNAGPVAAQASRES